MHDRDLVIVQTSAGRGKHGTEKHRWVFLQRDGLNAFIGVCSLANGHLGVQRQF